LVRLIHKRQPQNNAAKLLATVEEADRGLLTWDEPEHTRRVRETYDPPTLLYVPEIVDLLSGHLISIMGRVVRLLTGIK